MKAGENIKVDRGQRQRKIKQKIFERLRSFCPRLNVTSVQATYFHSDELYWILWCPSSIRTNIRKGFVSDTADNRFASGIAKHIVLLSSV